jgi:ABC-type phosphate/phosphonate transport system substrate-binding protein
MTPTQTPQILFKLKSIAEGATAGAAILTPNEGATLAKMTAPWTKSLSTIQRSQPVSTARVVLFSPIPKDADKLKQVMLNMRNDPEAKEILDEMRLAGFSEP